MSITQINEKKFILISEIRADFWQPQKNERKAELIKYWHQRAVLIKD